MKLKPTEKAKKTSKKSYRIIELEDKIRCLERELVSALEEHSRALVQRNAAEEITQSIYEALRRTLGICRK